MSRKTEAWEGGVSREAEAWEGGVSQPQRAALQQAAQC